MAALQPYIHATTAAAAGEWLSRAAGRRIVAIDTETSGWDPLRDALLCVQLCAGPDLPVLVLDTAGVDPGVLQPLLADPCVLKVFHHGAFDLRFLAGVGLRVTRVADTMLAQQLLDGGAKTASGNGLAQIAAFRLGVSLDKSIRGTVWVPGRLTSAQLEYAADDAAATWGVFDQQWRELVGHGLTRVAQLEFAALPVLADLQLRGVAFDADRWRRLVGGLERDLPALKDAAQAALISETSPHNLFGPEPVNLDSPEQVREALVRLGVEVTTTREVALRDFAGHPGVDALLAYRQVSKVTSSWGGDWADRAAHPGTGRIHPDWRQIVGAGRIACSDPSLHQIPKDARYRCCFGGAPGRMLVVADYSQQELRILAAVSEDEGLAEVFHGGGDLHRATAAMVFGQPEDAVLPAQRAAAKALNFGLMYGMGAPGFARATRMSLAQAQAVMDRYFAAFPRVAEWLAAAEAVARRTGRARTPLGRIRKFDGDQHLSTLARNAPIQGAGADMIKLALAEVDRRLAAAFGSPARGQPAAAHGPVLVVHDELVVEVPAERAEEGCALVVGGMLDAAREILGDVPPAVDVALRPRWGPEPAECAAQLGSSVTVGGITGRQGRESPAHE
ncbi:MAG: DNA polymerase [Egibacteraceae bacterium]